MDDIKYIRDAINRISNITEEEKPSFVAALLMYVYLLRWPIIVLVLGIIALSRGVLYG